MRTLLSVYRMPIRTYSPEGTFAAAACRLSEIAEGGFDGVLVSSFDSRAGTMAELVSLCARLHAMGLAVVLDMACLYSGVDSPAPVIDAAVRQGLADGFLLSDAEWQYPDVREAVAAKHKANDSLWFALSDRYPIAGERPDGAARRGFSPWSLLSAPQADAAWESALAAVGRGKGMLLTEVSPPPSVDMVACRQADLCLVLGWLLPGVPLVTPEAVYAVQALPQPTDEQRHAQLRRRALLERLGALRRTYPSLALSQGALHSSCHDGMLTFSRRVTDGTLYVCARLAPTEGALTDRTSLTVAPCLTSGVYSRDGRLQLSGYGFAVCFVPKVERPARAMDEDRNAEDIPLGKIAENASNYLQNNENNPK